jgi:hypothetical protein
MANGVLVAGSQVIFSMTLDFTKGVAFDPSKITWRLTNFATCDEYQSWEFHMQ